MKRAWLALLFTASLPAQYITTTITAHIRLEDGSALNASPMVVTPPGNDFFCRITDVFRDGTIMAEVRIKSPATGEVETPTCTLMKVALPGYRAFSGDIHDGSVIKLARIGEHEGGSVSIATINAPPAARKWYEKGESAMAHQRWDKAEKSFLQAVGLYPAYAPAWSELGAALDLQGDLEHAAAALRKAAAADPHYVKPLAQLAGLMEEQKRWDDELAASEQALQLNPVGFPDVYYYNAEAKYQLGQFDQAEKAARDAIRMDPNDESPRSHFLLGMLLARRGAKNGAVKEFRRYVKLDPRAADAQTAKAELDKLAQ